MVAGNSTPRMIVASIRMAAARPTPICLNESIESVAKTANTPTITSAALILGLAFVAFGAQPGTEAKIFALALGGGILIDATIIRGVLTPAAVAILGRWNWWFPDWAARVLRVDPSPMAPEANPDPAPQPT